MEILKGTAIGKIDVTVYETPTGEKLFQLNFNNEDVLPIVDILEDVLDMY